MAKHTSQIAIVGGGIAGLWLLNLLRKRGYDACLIEKNALGCEQTLASQGMIHGGLKYALSGFTTAASESIAGMPQVWRQCIEGTGPVDLKGLKILSKNYYLFSDGAISSKLTAFFASKALEARISALEYGQYPAEFKSKKFKGALYRLEDIVLDTPELLKRLVEPYKAFIYNATPTVTCRDTTIETLQITAEDTLTADHYIFAAGAGNESLIAETSLQNIKMQLRPLQQVMVMGDLPKIYAHAVSLTAGSKPRLTITSHPYKGGQTVWSLGGDLAEKGVSMTADALINLAKKEMSKLLPFVPQSNLRWATKNIARAEAAQSTGVRPDHPFVETKGNASVCWPTKLTLCPLLGDEILRQLDHSKLAKSTLVAAKNLGDILPLANIAPTPWENAFD